MTSPRALACPYCAASFTLADWAQKAACPECGRRLTFFEASGTATPRPVDDISALVSAAAPRSVIIESPPGRTLAGKPLRWTTGWTIVVAVWIAGALLLGVARADTTHWRAVSAAVAAAPGAMYSADLPGAGMTNEEAMRKAVLRLQQEGIVQGDPATYLYVVPRPWEHRIEVVRVFQWPDGDEFALAWSVNGDTATADPATLRFLQSALAPGGTLQLPADPSILEAASG